MPITINDCKTHKKTPELEAVGGLVIYCTGCEKLPECDTLYVSSKDAMKAIREWNRRNSSDD